MRKRDTETCSGAIFIYCMSKKKTPRKTSLQRIDDDCATSIDRASLVSIDRHLTVSIATASRVLIAT
uniref:Uncharacterized protein n=1 Tax=Brassica oleracea TaxID=3712 RepID=A0A3P6E4A0_BRAOL|nr:unnamed protein product [Brassica oleracea]